MKKFSIPFAFLCAVASTYSLAETPADKRQALNAAVAYAQATHCYDVSYGKHSLKDVFAIGENEETYSEDYAVLLYVNHNCSGGNGSGMNVLIPIQSFEELGGIKRFRVDTENYPSADLFSELYESELINQRFISDVKYNQNTRYLTFTSHVFADGDGNHTPSIKHRITLDLKYKEIIDGKYLGKERYY